MVFDQTERESYIQDRFLFNKIVNTLLLGKVIINDKGEVIYCNDVVSEETGYSKVKLYGMKATDLMENEESKADHNDFFKEFFDDPHPAEMRDVTILGKGGKKVRAKIKITPLVNYPSTQGMIQDKIKHPFVSAMATIIWKHREL